MNTYNVRRQKFKLHFCPQKVKVRSTFSYIDTKFKRELIDTCHSTLIIQKFSAKTGIIEEHFWFKISFWHNWDDYSLKGEK